MVYCLSEPSVPMTGETPAFSLLEQMARGTGDGEPEDVGFPRGGGGRNGSRAWPDWSSAHHRGLRSCPPPRAVRPRLPRPLTPAAKVWINTADNRLTDRALELPSDTQFVPQLSRSH
jgi:hypothetical protein